MQKVFNFLAVAAFMMSAGIYVGAGLVYVNRDAIADYVGDQVAKEIKERITLQIGENIIDNFIPDEKTVEDAKDEIENIVGDTLDLPFGL